MSVVIGFVLVLPGGVALLAGLTARDRVRRSRQHGTPAWGMVVPASTIAAGLRPIAEYSANRRI